jgi:NitT/TauT family transport system ATP-binding protein
MSQASARRSIKASLIRGRSSPSSARRMLFVTHDVDEAMMLGTRVIVVRNGSIAEDRAIDLPMPRSDDDLAIPEGLALKHLLLHHMGLE